MIRKMLVGGAVAAGLVAGLAACGGSSAPSVAGCKAAMKANIIKGLDGNYGISEQNAASQGEDPVTGQMPAQCKGYSSNQTYQWSSDLLAQAIEEGHGQLGPCWVSCGTR